MTLYALKLTEEQRRELLGILDREEERQANVVAFRVNQIRKAVLAAGRFDGVTGDGVGRGDVKWLTPSTA